MAGFVLPERVAIIEIDDGDFAGAEIHARLRLTMGMLREVMVALENLTSESDAIEAFGRLGDIFCTHGLISWNLVDSAGPIPADRSGWDRLDIREAGAIISGWMSGIARPPGPLPQPSSDTEPLPAGSRNGRRKASSRTSRQGSHSPSSVTT